MNNIRKRILQAIAEEKTGIERHEIIAQVLETMKGQKITKRVETRIRGICEPRGEKVFLKYIASLIQIEIWKDYNKDCTSHLIGYDSHAVVSMDPEKGFPYFDNCHGNAAKVRVERYREALESGAPEKLAAIIVKRDKLQDQIDALADSFDIKYYLKGDL